MNVQKHREKNVKKKVNFITFFMNRVEQPLRIFSQINGLVFADCQESDCHVNDDGESFYDCREVRGADDEWEKGWTSAGVIEAFHPDGVGE